MITDRPPSFAFPDTELGRAKMREFVSEEPDVLWGRVYLCTNYEAQRYPVVLDADWLRPKDLPACANRSRDGYRDMNICCRCAAGLPFTPQDKAHESYTDSAIRL